MSNPIGEKSEHYLCLEVIKSVSEHDHVDLKEYNSIPLCQGFEFVKFHLHAF